MNLPPDDDLRARFVHQRRCDHENAPVWREEPLQGAQQRQRSSWHWLPMALTAVCIVVAALFFARAPQPEPSLSEVLPPLFDAPSTPLFASLEPSFTVFEAPSDFLLTNHLIPHLP